MKTYILFGKHIFNQIITVSAVRKNSVAISGTSVSSIHRQESFFSFYIKIYVSIFLVHCDTQFVFCLLYCKSVVVLLEDMRYFSVL